MHFWFDSGVLNLMVCVQPDILSALLCYSVLNAKGYLRLITKIMMMMITKRIITIPKNKPCMMIRDSEKGTCELDSNKCCSLRRQKCDQERSREISKMWRPYNRNTLQLECNNSSDTSNNRVNWNPLEFTQKLPEQHIGKARCSETTQNSHTGHCTYCGKYCCCTVQRVYRGKQRYMCHIL